MVRSFVVIETEKGVIPRTPTHVLQTLRLNKLRSWRDELRNRLKVVNQQRTDDVMMRELQHINFSANTFHGYVTLCSKDIMSQYVNR